MAARRGPEDHGAGVREQSAQELDHRAIEMPLKGGLARLVSGEALVRCLGGGDAVNSQAR